MYRLIKERVYGFIIDSFGCIARHCIIRMFEEGLESIGASRLRPLRSVRKDLLEDATR